MILNPQDISRDASKITEDQKRDYALYFVEKGEPGFNPDHNKFVIDQTIKKYVQNRERKQKIYEESIRERADAVATYLKSRTAEGSTPIEKYFGRQWMAYLRGEKIVDVLKKKSLLGGKDRKVYLPGD